MRITFTARPDPAWNSPKAGTERLDLMVCQWRAPYHNSEQLEHPTFMPGRKVSAWMALRMYEIHFTQVEDC